jgi:hypothetical protein
MSAEEGQVSDGQINSEPEGGLVRCLELRHPSHSPDSLVFNSFACRSLVKSQIMTALVNGRVCMIKPDKD